MTAAERIEELEAEVAYLKGELVTVLNADEVAALRDALGFTWNQAMLVLTLYRSTRTVSHHRLVDAMTPGPERDVALTLSQVVICAVRKRLPHDAIATVWGIGYRMNDTGRDVIRKALEPVQ